jgi:pyruvate,orthophosphate dikinase
MGLFLRAGRAEGDGTWRDVLGGKGAGLAEMTKIGLPVPAGFTISTDACDYYYKTWQEVSARAEEAARGECGEAGKGGQKKLGDAKDPLLVSVRSDRRGRCLA